MSSFFRDPWLTKFLPLYILWGNVWGTLERTPNFYRRTLVFLLKNNRRIFRVECFFLGLGGKREPCFFFKQSTLYDKNWWGYLRGECVHKLYSHKNIALHPSVALRSHFLNSSNPRPTPKAFPNKKVFKVLKLFFLLRLF